MCRYATGATPKAGGTGQNPNPHQTDWARRTSYELAVTTLTANPIRTVPCAGIAVLGERKRSPARGFRWATDTWTGLRADRRRKWEGTLQPREKADAITSTAVVSYHAVRDRTVHRAN
jgi:hypothetical protein